MSYIHDYYYGSESGSDIPPFCLRYVSRVNMLTTITIMFVLLFLPLKFLFKFFLHVDLFYARDGLKNVVSSTRLL